MSISLIPRASSGRSTCDDCCSADTETGESGIVKEMMPNCIPMTTADAGTLLTVNGSPASGVTVTVMPVLLLSTKSMVTVSPGAA